MNSVSVNHESKLVQGSILDVARGPLLASLKRYDEQLYLKWRAGKKGQKGVWELRRKPEMKSIRMGRYLDTPTKGRIFFPGDVYEFDGFTIAVPKYHETREDCVKTFDHLDYRILDWIAKQDLWKFGYKGQHFASESDYLHGKYLDKVEAQADDDKQYMLKDMRTQINDFRAYVLAGGDPYRLIDYWGK